MWSLVSGAAAVTVGLEGMGRFQGRSGYGGGDPSSRHRHCGHHCAARWAVTKHSGPHPNRNIVITFRVLKLVAYK